LYYNNTQLYEENVEIIDLSKLSYREQLKEMKSLRSEIKDKFSIENTNLFRLFVFQLGERGQGLLFTAHHLLVDGISWRIILEDFITIVNQLQNNERIIIAQKTTSFKSWSESLYEYSEKDFTEETNYWRTLEEERVNNVVHSKEVEDKLKTSNTINCDFHTVAIEELIKTAKENYEMKFDEALIAALAVALNKWNNSKDITIELERHGREALDKSTDISRTVGWFTSMYPAHLKVLRNDIGSNFLSLREQLRNIPNKGFNYSIIKYLKGELKHSEDSLVRFNYLGDFDNILEDKSLGTLNIQCGLDTDENNRLTSKLDITAMIVNKTLRIGITYGKNKFKESTIEHFIDIYRGVLEECLGTSHSKNSNEINHLVEDLVAASQLEQ